MKTHTAFSLIEILVVIAIISILAALIFPMLHGAIEQSRQVTCISNLRQIGQSFNMYATDHDGRAPIGAYASSGSAAGDWDFSWHDSLSPYLGSHVDIFRCPRAPRGCGARYSYGANPWIVLFRRGGVLTGADRVLVAEKSNGDWPCYPRTYYDNVTHSYLVTRHGDGLCALFCDGSVRRFSPFDMGSLREHWIP